MALAVLAATARGDSFAHTSVIGADTCTGIDGVVSPLYMAAATCVSPTEANVQQRLRTTATLVNMDCITTADPGAGKTIVVVGRAGHCGALADVGTFTCTLTGGSGLAMCDSGTAKLVVGTAGDCWGLKLTLAAPLTTPVGVQCTMERAL